MVFMLLEIYYQLAARKDGNTSLSLRICECGSLLTITNFPDRFFFLYYYKGSIYVLILMRRPDSPQQLK